MRVAVMGIFRFFVCLFLLILSSVSFAIGPDSDNDGILSMGYYSLGYHHSCAIDDTGVVCWGDNEYGQTDVPELTFTFDEDATDTDTDANVTSAVLDIDANGSFDALTDGLIILRYAFGLRGENLVRSATAGDAMRTDAADVEAYLNSLVPGL